MNKKILITLILGILSIAGIFGYVVLDNGNIMLEDSEFSQVTNQQIANYMEHNLVITRYTKDNEKIKIYYNITYVEPTHDENNSYRVFTQEKGFAIGLDLWSKCLNLTSQSNCKNILVDREEPFIYEIQVEENMTENMTIYSTYYKAYNEQVRQYQRAIEFRDKLNYNELDDLENLL